MCVCLGTHLQYFCTLFVLFFFFCFYVLYVPNIYMYMYNISIIICLNCFFCLPTFVLGNFTHVSDLPFIFMCVHPDFASSAATIGVFGTQDVGDLYVSY